MSVTKTSCIVLFALAVLSCIGHANKTASSTSVGDAEKHSPRIEEIGCSLVEQVTSEAYDLQPAMRSYILRSASEGLAMCNPSTVGKDLVASFTASLEIPETEDQLDRQMKDQGSLDSTTLGLFAAVEGKQYLQTKALSGLLPIDEGKVDLLLPQSEPSVKAAVLKVMISRATRAKKLDRALRLIGQIPPGGRFPYSEATELMLELPSRRNSSALDLFLQAMVADNADHSLTIGGEDFATMVVRFWERLPSSVVLEAIHQLLDESQTMDEQISLGAKSGEVRFDNVHEFRVFELFPILKELDPDEAEKILADSQSAKAQLKQFPNGIGALDPAITSGRLNSGGNAGLTGTVGPNIGPMLQQRFTGDAFRSAASEVSQIAVDTPDRAIEAALRLPISEGSLAPRAQALLAIANVTKKKHPNVSKEALVKLIESLKDVPPARRKTRRDYWAEAVEIAADIEEVDLARKLLGLGLNQATELQNLDAQRDDPNLALKAWWPSAAVFSRLVQAAQRISRQAALDAIADVSDPDLRAFCRVNLAKRELGVPLGEIVVTVRSKASNWSETGSPEKNDPKGRKE